MCYLIHVYIKPFASFRALQRLPLVFQLLILFEIFSFFYHVFFVLIENEWSFKILKNLYCTSFFFQVLIVLLFCANLSFLQLLFDFLIFNFLLILVVCPDKVFFAFFFPLNSRFCGNSRFHTAQFSKYMLFFFFFYVNIFSHFSANFRGFLIYFTRKNFFCKNLSALIIHAAFSHANSLVIFNIFQ